MKTNILLLFVMLFAQSIFSQEVEEENLMMSLGSQNSFRVTIEGADKDMVEDKWEDYLKEFGKVKKNKKAKELYMLDSTIPLINGSSPIDVYSKVEERKGQSSLYVVVDMKGSFLNSDVYPKESENLRQVLFDFWVKVRKEVVSKELKDVEKTLEKSQKDLKKLEDKNKDLHEDIANYNEKIRKAELDIESNLKEQDDKRVEIEKNQEIVNGVVEKLNNIGRKD
ncbi:MAG TPA: hypothetical protein P5235_02880 [Saprospiraceae bacterium]|nr:hypothetical protein [Lewinellaceae bacterium]HPK09436.1 hypothetical protein [Saprospiraceae bacterium]HRX28300.1 hypothetical protein [Saprospiraceae bacterium]